MSESSSRNGGVGTLGLLGVAFVVLKLTGHIDWSWWWVTAPFWGPLAFIAAIVIGALPVVLIKGHLERRAIERLREETRQKLAKARGETP
ncbi:MAG: hypothetical protein AB7P02_05115 [Alphaproteobacteria bacterium]